MFTFLVFFYASIVRTFAQHRDDRRRVEKAFLDSTGLASGKVTSYLNVIKTCNYKRHSLFIFILNFFMKDDAISLSQFGFDDFYRFYKKLTGRQEVERIFEEL